MKFFTYFSRLALILCIASTSVLAQDEDLDGFEIDELDEEETSVPYFAVAAGFTANWYFPNLDDVNASLAKVLPDTKFDTPMFLTGWQGFLGIGLVDNVRIGYSHMSGNVLEEGELEVADPNVPGNMVPVNRRFQYGISYDAIGIDYAFTPIPRLAVLPGVAFGWGTMTLDASQSVTGQRPFDREFDLDGEQLNLARHLEASHFTFRFNLSVEYAFTRFAMLRVQGGYLLSAKVQEWEADYISTVSETDNVDIKPDGFNAQVGIFVGLFY